MHRLVLARSHRPRHRGQSFWTACRAQVLPVEPFFQTFVDKPIIDARRGTEALIALSCESREAVIKLVETALAAGARRYAEPKDHGFMYQWGFEDLDGHIWEHLWMDPATIQK